jgi:hypothetical protein
MYKKLSWVIPGEITIKLISILIEGIENDLLRVIWQVVLATPKTGNEIEFVVPTSPVRSAEVFAIIALILMGVGDDVERKLVHLIV